MTDVLDDRALKPIVMVVEDVPEHLDTRVALFEAFDCLAIGASSKTAAIRELSHTPRPDLVLTDIHMPELSGDQDDMSGYELAKYVRENIPGLPVAGYSAYFSDADLDSEVHDAFDEVYAKGAGGPQRLRSQVERCVRLAVESRESRLARFLERLDVLKAAHVAAVPSAEVRRRLVLDAEAAAHGSPVEGKLGDAGYRIRVISVASRLTNDPVVVWTIEDPTGFYVEVYGTPELYARGDTESEAIELLAELIDLLSAE